MPNYDVPTPAPFLPLPGQPSRPWNVWRDHFVDVFLVAASGDGAAISARVSKALLISCLGEEGQRIFSTLPPIVKQESETEFDMALRQLNQFFEAKTNVVVERFTFRQRAQHQGESTAEYASVLRGLAKTCAFGVMEDELIRDVIVEKTIHPRLRERFLQDSELTLDRALTLAEAYEQSLRQSAVIAGRSADHDTVAKVFPSRRPAPKPQPARTPGGHDSSVCTNCGFSDHPTRSPQCPARKAICHACGRKGHYASMCRNPSATPPTGASAPRKPPQRGKRARVKEASLEPHVLSCSTVPSSVNQVTCPVLLEVEGRQEQLSLQVDTGATCSILSTSYARQLFRGCTYQPTSSNLFGFGKAPLPVTGTLLASVSFQDRSVDEQFFLVDTASTEAIMGLGLMQKLGVTIHPVSGKVFSVTEERQESLPTIKGYQHKIILAPDAKPTCIKLRRLPLSVRDEVSKELQRLLQEGIIERIEASPWVNPLVVSRKANGQIRLCVDLRGPNAQIVAESHPLPTIEELQSKLQGVMYSKIDLRSAYHQLELHPDSRDITAFLTHDGLMRFRRVPFGLVSAGSACQRLLDDLLRDVKGCGHYLDDILITGQTQQQHDERLRTVLDRLKKANVTVNLDKSVFGKTEVNFCGHRLSPSGITPTEVTVQAVMDAPRPTNVKELRSFLGLTGWSSRFIPAYADVIRPLAVMLRKDVPFEWTEDTEASFLHIKRLISRSPVLKPFNPDLPTVVTSDASERGAGAVLSQVHPGGAEHPVAYWSRSFTETEQRYSVSEREALSAVQAVERWKVYLWGRLFTLRTDHSALQTLLSPKFSGRAGARVARWQARLLPYAYHVVYTPGNKIPVADALSRLPLPSTDPVDEADGEEVFALVKEEPTSALTEEKVRQASQEDPVLQQLRDIISRGWPASAKSCPPDVKPFFTIRHELQVRGDSVVLRGPDRVVVPSSLRHDYVSIAHRAHDGIVRTKQLIRSLAWWPGVDRDVTAAVLACDHCQASDKVLNQAVIKAPLQPVPYPDKPWSKVGVDIVGPIPGAPHSARFAVTVVDYHSKWAEAALTPSVTTEAVISVLSAVWAREGFPDELITDNGTQLTSKEFEDYLARRGIRHHRSSVYWPRGNAAVERFNRTFKVWVQDALKQSQVSFHRHIQVQLARFRATPHCTTGKSPSEMLHGRIMRLQLPVISETPLVSSQLQEKIRKQQRRNKRQYDSRHRTKRPNIREGDWVCIKKPGITSKSDSRFTAPLRVSRQVAPATFQLETGAIWNAAHLARVPSAAGGRPSTTQHGAPHPDGAAPNQQASPSSPTGPTRHSPDLPSSSVAPATGVDAPRAPPGGRPPEPPGREQPPECSAVPEQPSSPRQPSDAGRAPRGPRLIGYSSRGRPIIAPDRLDL